MSAFITKVIRRACFLWIACMLFTLLRLYEMGAF